MLGHGRLFRLQDVSMRLIFLRLAILAKKKKKENKVRAYRNELSYNKTRFNWQHLLRLNSEFKSLLRL